MAKMLEKRFGRYAKGAFGDKLPHLVEEAVGEMFTRLCSELKDLEPRAELYERKVQPLHQAPRYLGRDQAREKTARDALPG